MNNVEPLIQYEGEGYFRTYKGEIATQEQVDAWKMFKKTFHERRKEERKKDQDKLDGLEDKAKQWEDLTKEDEDMRGRFSGFDYAYQLATDLYDMFTCIKDLSYEEQIRLTREAYKSGGVVEIDRYFDAWDVKASDMYRVFGKEIFEEALESFLTGNHDT
jgi:hypothetical protein